MRKYTIQTHKRVDKFLASHPDIARQFVQKIDILEDDPLSKQLDIKPMKGKQDTYRLRIGDYRLIYTIDHHRIIVFFFAAGGRGDIYKT